MVSRTLPLALLLAAAPGPIAGQAGADEPLQRWRDSIPAALLPLPAAVTDDKNAFILWRDRGPAVKPPDQPEGPDGEPLCADGAPFSSGAAGDALRAWLGRCEPLLALLDEGLRRGEYRPRPDVAGDDWSRCLRTVSHAMDACGLRAKLAAREGRFDDALGDVERLVRLARLLEAGLLLDLNFAHAARARAAEAARRLGADRALPEAAHARLIAACLEPPGHNALAAILRQEYFLYAVPAIGALPEDASGPGLARTIRALVDDLSDELPGRRMAVAAILEGHPRPLDRAETLGLLGNRVLSLMERARAPWRVQLEPLADAEPVAAAAALWPAELREGSGKTTPPAGAVARSRRALREVANPLGKLVASDHLRDETAGLFDLGYGSFARGWFLSVARRELTLAALGAQLDEKRRGAVPSDLHGIIERGALPRGPIDPYDGAPIRYDAARRLVWACGPDGDDDGGRPPAEDDDAEDGDEVLSTRWEEGR